MTQAEIKQEERNAEFLRLQRKVQAEIYRVDRDRKPLMGSLELENLRAKAFHAAGPQPHLSRQQKFRKIEIEEGIKHDG